MDIAGILRNFGGVTPVDGSSKSERAAEAAAVPESGDRPTLSLSPQSQQALRDILARYDVTDISSREFSELILELKQSGAITSADQEELALVRLELDQQGADPDERLNLPELFQRKLQTQERELERQEQKQGRPIDRSEALRATLRQIDWISKFAMIHQSPGNLPLNAVA